MSPISQLKKENNDLISDDYEKACLLNNYFCSISTLNDSRFLISLLNSELNQTLSFSLIVTSFWGTQFLIISINIYIYLSEHSHKLFDIMRLNDLKNMITEPTRTCNTRQTLLDPVLVSDNCNVLESYVIQVDRKYNDHEANLSQNG
jgi:hypothetical protein